MHPDLADDYGMFTPRHLDPIACSVPDVYPVQESPPYGPWAFSCVDCGVRVERDFRGAVPLWRPFCQPCRDIRTGAGQPSEPEPPMLVEADFRAEQEPVAKPEQRPVAVAAGDEMQLELFGGIT